MANRIPVIEVGRQGPAGPQGPTGNTGSTGATANISATSTTSVNIGTGAKVFTVQSGRQIGVGDYVMVSRTAAPGTHWMHGIVTAYSGTSMTVDVQILAGSGSYNAWTINKSGPAGPIAGFSGNGIAATASHSDHFHELAMVAGNYYSNVERGFGTYVAAAPYVMPAGRVNFAPIFIPHSQSFDRIGLIVEAAVATSTVRLGIWTCDMASMTMTRLLDSGNIATTSIGYQEAAITWTAPAAGWYWLSIIGNNLPSVRLYNNGSVFGFATNNTLQSIATAVATGVTYGALPATIVTTTVSGGLWPIILRSS